MEKIHVFQSAGLGIAPFEFTGYFENRTKQGQPAGTCQYCGNGIAICCRIRSSDGKEFTVGSDCVNKTGDSGMKSQVNRMKAKLNIEKQDAQILANMQWIENNKEVLSKIPYGKYNLLESIEWFYKNAGRSGKIRIIREAKKLLISINK